MRQEGLHSQSLRLDIRLQAEEYQEGERQDEERQEEECQDDTRGKGRGGRRAAKR